MLSLLRAACLANLCCFSYQLSTLSVSASGRVKLLPLQNLEIAVAVDVCAHSGLFYGVLGSMSFCESLIMTPTTLFAPEDCSWDQLLCSVTAAAADAVVVVVVVVFC